MPALARAGETCWRIERAGRIALLVDNESYFAAVAAALRRARRSVLILGWTFDPRTRLEPGDTAHGGECMGDLLRALAGERPELGIRVLIWDVALPVSVVHGFYPQRAAAWFKANVQFRLDDRHPAGACHHQKLVVIDDALAFCSGADFTVNRWDSTAHRDCDRRRRLPSGKPHRARHSASIAVDGEAAVALGELARERWARASGEVLQPPRREGDPWPADLGVDLADFPVGIARTAPAYRAQPGVSEIERLYLEAIAAARRLIYIENQYLASPRIVQALAARLMDRDGPEVIMVLPARGPSYFDRLAMDPSRDAAIRQLRALDRHGRFHAYAPFTAGGHEIVVHSKVMVVDERFLCVGSGNLSNRTLGFDTECNLVLDTATGGERIRAAASRTVAMFLHRLVGHFTGATAREAEHAMARYGSLAGAIEALKRPRANRLRRLRLPAPGMVGTLIAEYHLGDPESPEDAFRPWRRRAGPARRPRPFPALTLAAIVLVTGVLVWRTAPRRLRGS